MPAWGFLIVLNILLLAAGNFMEPTSVVLILTPIVYPIALQLGIDPVHLGIIMVLNMQMGLVTPPVGLNLFVTAGVARDVDGRRDTRVLAVAHGAAERVDHAITYIPAISLIVPQMLGTDLIEKNTIAGKTARKEPRGKPMRNIRLRRKPVTER